MTAGAPQPRPIPGLLRLLGGDFLCFIAALFPVVVVGLGTALAFFGHIPGMLGRDPLGSGDLPYFLAFGALVLLVCLPLLWLRVRWLRGLLARGEEAAGRLRRVRRARNGTRIQFVYRFNGKSYDKSVLIPTWRDDLEADDAVSVIVDPNKPGTAVIKSLFVTPPPRSP